MSGLGLFHFLRPGWLWLLLPAIAVFWSLWRRQDPSRSWQAVISPELLPYLVVKQEEQNRGWRPLFLLISLWALGIIALAGPAWQKEPTPFTEDQAAVFFVVKVTPEMLAQDIQPSRLQRAAQKIEDLLALRAGSRSGLIAYAGSPHLVMPLTADPDIIAYFAAELSPDVMPREGDDPLAALELATERLQRSAVPGSVVLLADYVAPAESEDIEELHETTGIDIHVLAMAAGPEVVPPPDSPPAPALDFQAMSAAADAGGGVLVEVTPDDSDLRELNARIDRSIAAAPAQEGERWRDAGYWLLPVFMVFVLCCVLLERIFRCFGLITGCSDGVFCSVFSVFITGFLFSNACFPTSDL